jgi:hypothetical protein
MIIENIWLLKKRFPAGSRVKIRDKNFGTVVKVHTTRFWRYIFVEPDNGTVFGIYQFVTFVNGKLLIIAYSHELELI